MMYVVCFYWIGERWVRPGAKINEVTEDRSFQRLLTRVGGVDDSLAVNYVDNLYAGVKRNAEEEFKFVCFTNEPLKVRPEVEIRPLPMHTDKGVLPRMHMFSREAGLFGHQVLSLDLDVIITGSLKDLMGYRGTFCTRSAFAPGEEGKLDGDIISFSAGEETENIFWKPFINDIDKAVQITQGRERFWVRHVAGDIADIWQDVTPGQVVSYKRHVMRGKRIPPNARIVSCHGHPRPHMIQEKYLNKHWSDETH
jgi:hypothetical protein